MVDTRTHTHRQRFAGRRYTVEEFEALADSGAFGIDEHVELLDGEVVCMPPMHSPHAAAILRLTRIFGPILGDRAWLSIQLPVRIPPRSMPEPDVALFRPRADDYADTLADAADVLLVIEVMDSSRHSDPRRKLPVYARAAIPEVWLIDLPARTVTVCRAPSGNVYADTTQHTDTTAKLAPRALPDAAIAITSILGPA